MRERSVLCWQADGISCCLLRSSTSHPITPASSYQLVVCHLLSPNIHSHSLCQSLSPQLLSHLFSACLLCLLHVECQVQSQLTGLLRRGCKTRQLSIVACYCYSCITPSVSGEVCIGKAPVCWEASKAPRVSKELLRWYLAAIYSH